MIEFAAILMTLTTILLASPLVVIVVAMIVGVAKLVKYLNGR